MQYKSGMMRDHMGNGQEILVLSQYSRVIINIHEVPMIHQNHVYL